MSRLWVRWGSFFMLTGVLAGAFGAHALRNVLSESMKPVFQTAVHYQLIHGLALFIVAWLSSRSTKPALRRAGIAFSVGIVLFSGSLYALALTNSRFFGILTPFGGLGFVAGWCSILLSPPDL